MTAVILNDVGSSLIGIQGIKPNVFEEFGTSKSIISLKQTNMMYMVCLLCSGVSRALCAWRDHPLRGFVHVKGKLTGNSKECPSDFFYGKIPNSVCLWTKVALLFHQGATGIEKKQMLPHKDLQRSYLAH